MNTIFLWRNLIPTVIVFMSGVLSHAAAAAIMESQNSETAAMLVSLTNPMGVKLFSYVNTVLFQ